MARLAATDFAADWVFNADADEFWCARGGSFRELFAAIPGRFGVVRGAWRNFVPRPDDDRFFAERMTARLSAPSFHPHPLTTHFKSAHRGAGDVRIGRGNHEAFGDGLFPLRGWYPIEILHFPVRSLEHCRRKYVTQFVALERNAEKGIAGHMAEAYRAYRAGALDAYYEPLVVDDDELRLEVEAREARRRHQAPRQIAHAWIRRRAEPERSRTPIRRRSPTPRRSPPSTPPSTRRTSASRSARRWTSWSSASRGSSAAECRLGSPSGVADDEKRRGSDSSRSCPRNGQP